MDYASEAYLLHFLYNCLWSLLYLTDLGDSNYYYNHNNTQKASIIDSYSTIPQQIRRNNSSLGRKYCWLCSFFWVFLHYFYLFARKQRQKLFLFSENFACLKIIERLSVVKELPQIPISLKRKQDFVSIMIIQYAFLTFLRLEKV